MAMEWVALTSAELKEKGEELANALGELDRIKGEKKNAMNDFKSRIDAKEREISEISQSVRLGKELRARTFFDNQIDD